MKKLVQVMVVATVVCLGTGVAQATLLFSDNFNFTGTVQAPDYGLNEQLATRQSGSLAPLSYTRISGSAYYGYAQTVQVNGELNFVGQSYNTNPAVSIGPFGGGEYTLSIQGTIGSADGWIGVTVLAAAAPFGNGTTVNDSNTGVGLLIAGGGYAGQWQLFMGDTQVTSGSGIPGAPTYDITLNVDRAQNRISAKVNGDTLFTNYSVTSDQGDYVWLGKYGVGTSVFNELEITVPEPGIVSLLGIGFACILAYRRAASRRS